MFEIITLVSIWISSTFLISSFYYFKYDDINNDTIYIKNSRILSFINACITSIIGIYKFLYIYNKIGLYNYSCENTFIDDFSAVFFIIYLCLDLIIGYLEYPKGLGVLSGYVHHLSFIPIMIYIYNNNYTACSSLIYIFEVPTIFLSAKYLFPKYKIFNDLMFGILFLLIRICLHFKLICELFIDYFYYNNEDKYYFIPVMCLMFLLHIYWYNLYNNKLFKKTLIKKNF